MAVDISSGVNSIIAASGQGQRVAQIAGENNRQDKQRLMGAVSDLGTAYAASKRKEKQLTSLNGVADLAGVPPDSPARGDAQALMLEIKQRHGAMDAQQRADLQAKAQSILMGHEKDMQTQRTNDALDVDAAQRRSDLALSERQAKEQSELVAPVDDMLNIMGSSLPIKREAGQEDIYGRARSGAYTRESLKAALGGVKEPAAPKLSPYEERKQTLQADKEMGAGDFAPKTASTSTPRIDPLSPEGIDAKVKLWQQTEGTKRPEEMKADAMLRIQDAEYMAGIPPGDRLTYKALAGKDFMKPEEVRELKRITEAANAAWAAKSGGNAPPGAGDAPSSGAKDPASLKARFDAMTPEQQEAFLSKATPEQRAKVGR